MSLVIELLMLLLVILVVIAIAYAVIWGIGLLPIQQPFKSILYAVAAIVLILFLLLKFKLLPV